MSDGLYLLRLWYDGHRRVGTATGPMRAMEPAELAAARACLDALRP